MASMITASSLQKEYITLTVQVTKDGVPVIYEHPMIQGIGFDLNVTDLTFEQFQNLPLPSWLQEIKMNRGLLSLPLSLLSHNSISISISMSCFRFPTGSSFNIFEEKKKVLESGTPSLIHSVYVSLADLLKVRSFVRSFIFLLSPLISTCPLNSMPTRELESAWRLPISGGAFLACSKWLRTSQQMNMWIPYLNAYMIMQV